MLLTVLISSSAKADDPVYSGDFGYYYEGHTLSYTITSNSTCMVFGKAEYALKGPLIIPAVAEHWDGKKYTVTAIRKHAFENLDEMTSVVIPNSVLSIGECAFSRCTGLTAVTLPNNVTKIDQAFTGCTGLTSVEIPGTVTSMDYACANCDNIMEIYYKTADPIECDKNVFHEAIYARAKLYVAKGGLKKAETTCPWYYFKLGNIEEKDFAGIEVIEADSDDSEIDFSAPFKVYNLQGEVVANSINNLTPGIYIVRQGSATRKVVIGNK